MNFVDCGDALPSTWLLLAKKLLIYKLSLRYMIANCLFKTESLILGVVIYEMINTYRGEAAAITYHYRKYAICQDG